MATRHKINTWIKAYQITGNIHFLLRAQALERKLKQKYNN
jgi:hypothetical protein